MDLYKLSLRQLQRESARALCTMQATNNNIYQFNKQAHHDSEAWYRAVIQWYLDEYGDLPSCVGPGSEIKLLMDKPVEIFNIEILSFLNGKSQELLKSLSEINNTWHVVGEPVEILVDRLGIDNKYLVDKKIITCNSESIPGYNLERHPFFYAHSVAFSHDIEVSEKTYDHKKFICMLFLRTQNRKTLANKLLEYQEHGYCQLHDNTDLKNRKKVNYKQIPAEYNYATWEFGIESGGYKNENYMYKCFTEKTWRPLCFGKPFLVFGYPGMYKRLESYGFRLSSDINYEFDQDVPNRFELFCNEVERIICLNDYTNMINDAVYNQEIFKKLVKETVDIDPGIGTLNLTQQHRNLFDQNLDHPLLRSYANYLNKTET